ncbi:MAG TPA: G1 family glutamic endopeptidase [Streptosporangiaceae bacterium]|nr:G1 family glutamic endopeptidase [Streptosporangiaceae bacterium]
MIVDNKETNTIQTVHAGDLVKATVVSSTAKTTATLRDLTKGHTFTFTRSGSGAATLEEQFVETTVRLEGVTAPVANFGKITFIHGAVSGQPLGSVTPREAINMVSSAKVLQIHTGPLFGPVKGAFNTTFDHS